MLILRLLTICLILALRSVSRDVTRSSFQKKVVIIIHTIAVLLTHCKITHFISCHCHLWWRYTNWQSAWLHLRFFVMIIDMLEYIFGAAAVVAAVVGVRWRWDIRDNGQRSH